MDPIPQSFDFDDADEATTIGSSAPEFKSGAMKKTVAQLRSFPVLAQDRSAGLLLGQASAADVFISSVIVGVAFFHAWRDTGVSLYCLAIQSLAHAISSGLIVLRFVGEYKIQEGPESVAKSLIHEQKRVSLFREQRLSLIMCGVMLVSSCALLFKAIRKLAFWGDWYMDHIDLEKDIEWATGFLAVYGFLVYSFHAGVRFVMWMVLRKAIIWQGFVVSLVSVSFLAVLWAASGYEQEWSWKVEPVVAIGLSVVTLVEAGHIFRLQWSSVDDRIVDPYA
mmetsp:Transcript_13722/g.37525  ORF Transcript_13722/g.37525 Transcript_13722/m.37525 type:complete len:279 (-) Transcript_13722:225-1061(-)